MKKLALLVAAMAFVPALFASTSVFADSPGQLSNGDNNYKVRNVTKNGTYGKSTSVTCNETVKYSITLSNSDFGLLKDLTVKANLASGAISASAVNAEGATTSVSGNVSVAVEKGTLNYVPGSSVRISSDNTTRTPLSDGVATTGVNAGNLNGSTATFVQFDAKVNCPVEPKDIQVCEVATKKIITIKETDFNASKHSKNLDDCKEVVKKIKVCEVATKKIITIDEKNFDASKHSKNLADCAEKPPVPGEIVVCETATKKIVTIKENEFDASKHTRDLSTCDVTPVTPETPAELPQTGAEGALAFVAAVLAAGIGYIVTGRRNLLG